MISSQVEETIPPWLGIGRRIIKWMNWSVRVYIEHTWLRLISSKQLMTLWYP